MANYNKDTDYTALIEQAVKSGNYAGAALLEQQRNNKISDMGLNYEQTNQYGQYLLQVIEERKREINSDSFRNL